jgi:hypothetical protein
MNCLDFNTLRICNRLRISLHLSTSLRSVQMKERRWGDDWGEEATRQTYKVPIGLVWGYTDSWGPRITHIHTTITNSGQHIGHSCGHLFMHDSSGINLLYSWWEVILSQLQWLLHADYFTVLGYDLLNPQIDHTQSGIYYISYSSYTVQSWHCKYLFWA